MPCPRCCPLLPLIQPSPARPFLRRLSTTPTSYGPREALYHPWKTRAHTRPDPVIPPPLPAIFAQKVTLSDGSTFTSYTTAPSPAAVQLTRDVMNNTLWAPGTERRLQGGEEGRVGRFRRRFEGVSVETPAGEVADPSEAGELVADSEQVAQEDGFGEGAQEWMSDGAETVKIPKKSKFLGVKRKR